MTLHNFSRINEYGEIVYKDDVGEYRLIYGQQIYCACHDEDSLFVQTVGECETCHCL
jgi:hypothetical protein